ncbi:hypothetical protein [Acetobacter sp. DsW_063]|uniref:glycine-rich domain-containing protein n=1 Tax=Acetobacter sp. DsW_063 TaxID=1514894 RepID=UPI000A3C8319|nr:hypothetical protein [Acetobacter sp. DsW_063]OUJ16291.1 hypothetical protein HK28_01335 [Acetobacter sp. DsW_063]
MDRVIVYPGQVISDTDTLIAQRNAEIAIGNALSATIGTAGPFAVGFAATCNGQDLVVTVASGHINEVAVIDADAYGSMAADSAQVVRQYVSPGASFTLSATSAAQTFYISASLSSADTNATLLRYVDASDDSLTLAGQNGDGASQATIRAAIATLEVTTAPPVDGGILIWSVVLPANATAVTQSMISLANSALFYPTIPQLAPKDSPLFTGSPRAPTPTAGDQSTLLATTAFVGSWASGNLLSIQSYVGPSATTGGANTFSLSVQSRCKRVIIAVSAGGGGGGGCPTCTATQAGIGGGGGAGAYALLAIDPSLVSFPLTVSLGCGGRGGQSSAGAMSGNSGGPSSIGSFVTLGGGFGGVIGTGSGEAVIGGAGVGGNPQVVTTSGVTVIVSSKGQGGQSGLAVGISENYFFGYGGMGGNRSPYSGGEEAGAGQTGNAGELGSGGSGACVSPGTTYQNGGDGGSGWMVVMQYG